MDKATLPARWWKRLPLRLSVRALMILILVAGGSFGWVVNQARLQREAVAAIEGCNGGVWYYGHSPFSREPPAPEWLRRWLGVDFLGAVEDVDFSYSLPDGSPGPQFRAALARLPNLSRLRELWLHGETATDFGLVHIQGLTRLEYLEINWSADGVTDVGVACLKRLTNLKILTIQDTRMTDQGVAHLGKLSRLESLMIDRNPITDEGLAKLRSLTRLKYLHVGGARVEEDKGVYIKTFRSDEITDAGLVHLKGLTELRGLGIEGTGVTDQGLRHLEGLSKLTHLYIAGTRITDAGAKTLQQAIPGLKIHRKPAPIEAPEIPPPDEEAEDRQTDGAPRGGSA
jgi:Leucine Rich repeat